MRTKVLVCVVLFSLLCGLAEARGRRSYLQSSVAPDTSSVADDPAPLYPAEKEMLVQINVIRERYGLVPFILDSAIHALARRHCIWMTRARSMTHGGGYAENIAMGQPNVESVLSSWMNSSGHRANILNPRHTKIGIAGYTTPEGTAFWCQRFAR